jgi:hypothetical protein
MISPGSAANPFWVSLKLIFLEEVRMKTSPASNAAVTRCL